MHDYKSAVLLKCFRRGTTNENFNSELCLGLLVLHTLSRLVSSPLKPFNTVQKYPCSICFVADILDRLSRLRKYPDKFLIAASVWILSIKTIKHEQCGWDGSESRIAKRNKTKKTTPNNPGICCVTEEDKKSKLSEKVLLKLVKRTKMSGCEGKQKEWELFILLTAHARKKVHVLHLFKDVSSTPPGIMFTMSAGGSASNESNLPQLCYTKNYGCNNKLKNYKQVEEQFVSFIQQKSLSL